MAAIGIGTKFYAQYADGNAAWVIVKARGKDTWEAEIAPESLDYVGTRRVFGGEEIRRAKRTTQLFHSLRNEHDEFWASRKIGEIVHYHSGFGQYVRGEVVEKDGKKVMKSTALVGDWRSYDLPHRNRFGKVEIGYHAQKVIEGDTFQPNSSNVVEGGFRPRSGFATHPRDLPALDLTVPAADEVEVELQRLIDLRERAAAILSGIGSIDNVSPDSVRDILKQAKSVLEEA